MAVHEYFTLKSQGHSGHLNSSVAMLYSCSAFADVMLATSDGHCFSAHQLVLSAYSPYFHNMITVGGKSFATNSKLVIVLPPEIEHSTLGIILQFIYKGEAIIKREQLSRTMKAAEILQIRGLYKDKWTNGNSILKHFNPESKSKTNSETGMSNCKATTTEQTFSLNLVSNNVCCTSSTASRQTSTMASTPLIKNYKREVNNSLTECKNNTCSDDILFENIGEQIQVKDEPIDWEDQQEGLDSNIVKEEFKFEEEELNVTDVNRYAPLTCDICQETFTLPALWVRHVETEHPNTPLAGAKRARVEDDSKEYPPLHCDECQKVFSVPAEWVRHLNTHKESCISQKEQANNSTESSQSPYKCNTFNSHTSMEIQIRKHTGEGPFICKPCNRKFIVKSNFIRHMCREHNQIENRVSSQ